MDFRHFSRSAIIAYIKFFDILLNEPTEKKNYEVLKNFKRDAEQQITLDDERECYNKRKIL